MDALRRFKALGILLILLSGLSLAGCSEEEEQRPEPPPEAEESFDDSTGGGSA